MLNFRQLAANILQLSNSTISFDYSWSLAKYLSNFVFLPLMVSQWRKITIIFEWFIELMINKLHVLSPSGGLVSPSGGFASLLFDQVGYFASIKLCQALSHQGAMIKIPVVRCHYLLWSSRQYTGDDE